MLGLAVLAFVLYGLCGCSMLRRRGPFPSVGVGEVLSRLEEKAAAIEDFEGRAEVRMWGMGPNRRAWLRVLFKEPDRMKLQVDGAFGMRVLEASLCGEQLRAYFPTSNRLIEERSRAFWRNWVGWEVAWSDVRDVLLGTVGLGRADSVYVSTFERTEEGYVLVVEKGTFLRRLRVDGWNLAATEEEVWDRSGYLIGRRTMGRFKKVDGVFLPERIELTQGANRVRGTQRMEIAFISRRVNRGLSDARLELSVPDK